MPNTPPNPNVPQARSAEPKLPDAALRLNELLASLWVRSRSSIAERLESLRSAQRRLELNLSDEQARHDGVDAAHKLAGILGTFGLPRGTELARQAELLLYGDSILIPERIAELKGWIDELEVMVQRKSIDSPPLRAGASNRE